MKPQEADTRLKTNMKKEQRPILPGFFIEEGRDYAKGFCSQWLQAFGYDTVPVQHLDVPLGIRIHDVKRDLNNALDAVTEGLRLGFTPHVNFAREEDVTQKVLNYFTYGVIISVGNSMVAGSGMKGYKTLMDYTMSATKEVQDDSGVRGAVANLSSFRDNWNYGMPYPNMYNFHMYGNAGASPKHLRRLRKWFPHQDFTIGELHWGFRGKDDSRVGHEGLYTKEAGAYCREMVEQATELHMSCILFLGKDFFNRDGSFTESMKALTGEIKAKPYKPSRIKSMRLTLGMFWQRMRDYSGV